MAKFATASDALTTALAIVDSRLTNINIDEQLELYIELIDRRAKIQQAIATSGGGGSSSITTNSSIEYGAGATTAMTQRVAIATDANLVALANGVPDIRSLSNTINSATLNAAYTVNITNGAGIAAFSASGLTASGATLTIEASDDNGITWNSTNGVLGGTGTTFSTFTVDRQFRVNAAGRTQIKLRVSIIGTGAITISSNLSTASGLVVLSTPLPQLPSDGNFPITTETGLLTYRNTGLTNTAVAVKTSSGNIRGWNFINVNTVAVYVKFYDIASGSVVVGTSTIIRTVAIPAGSASNPAIFFLETQSTSQEDFTTAISMACVTGLADNSSVAPSTAIHASVRYK